MNCQNSMRYENTVMRGLDPRIHVHRFYPAERKAWMAGSDPRVEPGDGHDDV